MKIIIEEIEQAIDFISADPTGDSEAFLSLVTGEVYYRSEYMEDAPLPVDIDDNSKYLSLPHKRQLDLGVVLVFQFVEKQRPDSLADVRAMFRKSGAYRRFSDWLSRYGIEENWYRFRDQTTQKAILAWLEDNGVDV
jgi:hypothetical protein